MARMQNGQTMVQQMPLPAEFLAAKRDCECFLFDLQPCSDVA